MLCSTNELLHKNYFISESLIDKKLNVNNWSLYLLENSFLTFYIMLLYQLLV